MLFSVSQQLSAVISTVSAYAACTLVRVCECVSVSGKQPTGRGDSLSGGLFCELSNHCVDFKTRKQWRVVDLWVHLLSAEWVTSHLARCAGAPNLIISNVLNLHVIIIILFIYYLKHLFNFWGLREGGGAGGGLEI